MIDIMTSPLFINGMGSESFEGFVILHRISLPNVIALIKLKESIVDIRVARIPMIKRPNIPTGRIFIASNGYVRSAFPFCKWLIAYNPHRMVRQSNTAQNPIAISMPFFAVFFESAAAQRWKKPGSMNVHAAIKNQTIMYWRVFPPKGSKKFSGKVWSIVNGLPILCHKYPSNRKNPKNIRINCNRSVLTTAEKPPFHI